VQYQGEQENPDFLYEVGVEVDHALLVKRGRWRRLFVSRLNLELARERLKGWEVEALTREVWRSLRGKRVGLSYAYHSAAFVEGLRRKGTAVEDVGKVYRRKRRIKGREEVERLRRLEGKSLKALEEVLEGVEVGMREKEVEALAFRAIARRGRPAFHPIVAGDRRTRFPHYRAGRGRVERLLLIDLGVGEVWKSDITHTVVLRGREERGEWEELVGLFFSLLDYAREEGPLTMGALQRKAEGEMAKRGWRMPHSIGHGIGLEVHESPLVGEKALLRSTVIALEPAFYTSRRGMRVERMVWFDEKGRPRLLNPWKEF